MALGDGVRRNIAHVSTYERQRFRDAIVALNSRYYPDGISKWAKQNEIHKATSTWAGNDHSHHNRDVHREPVFLPWHRELCNRFELLLREVDATLSLHYWDWTEDPRKASNGTGGTVDLFTEQFMGKPSAQTGRVEAPFVDFPRFTRDAAFASSTDHSPSMTADLEVIDQRDNNATQDKQWKEFRDAIERPHGSAHSYIGGSIGDADTAFQDPFVFLLHSNVDRLWAMWQTVPGKEWRLNPDKIYGDQTHDRTLVGPLEPWAGKKKEPLRPWAPPENQQVVKNSKDLTVVVPPRYDTEVVIKDGVKGIQRSER